MLVILGVTVIMLANKFFSLIHYLSEHVTNWIGQQFHSLGEKEDQAGAKNVFMGSTSAVSEAGRGGKELAGRVGGNKGAGGNSGPAPVSSHVSEENFRS